MRRKTARKPAPAAPALHSSEDLCWHRSYRAGATVSPQLALHCTRAETPQRTGVCPFQAGGPGPCTKPAMEDTRLNSFAMFTLEKIIRFRKRQARGMPAHPAPPRPPHQSLAGGMGRDGEQHPGGPSQCVDRGGSLKPTSQVLLSLRAGSDGPLGAAGQAAEGNSRLGIPCL